MVELTAEDVRKPADDGSRIYSNYQHTLAVLSYPVSIRCVFGALSGTCLALLGYPLLGLGWTLMSCLADGLMQAWLGHAIRTSPGADEARGFRWLSLVTALRSCIYVSAPMIALLLGAGPEVLVYMGSVAATSLVLSISNSRASKSVVAAQAAPVLLAMAVGGYLAFGLRTGSGLLLGLISLTGVLFIIWRAMQNLGKAWLGSHDITVRLVGELREARDTALEEREAADAAREEARRANAAKSNFLATMSHEIRTPMNGVLGMAQLMRRAEREPEQLERIETLIQSGESLLSILNDILDVSKIDAGRLDLAPKAEDLNLFLTRLVNLWRPRADEKRLALDLQIDDSAPRHVWMDGLRVGQVLSNLLGNALKFTDEGGVALSVSGEPIDDDRVLVRISVADTGVGIDAEALSTLFERFSQADDSAARKYGGTGLGLAIARQLAELMGGRVWVESGLGAGSTFHVELPLELAQATGPSDGEAADADHAELRPMSVLAVDDNAVNLMVLEQVLPSFGHSVVKAQSGPEALEWLARQAFDVVLLDIQMPGMSGFQVLEALRAASGPNQAVPVVALTADVTSGGRERYLALGFDDYAAKPLQIADLMAAVARAVTAAPAPEAAPVTAAA
ncbi:MAG: sensor histidine kinase/response regulator [Phenylobacterium sp.]|nr:sensor histidine kinase/response regulator [Phenylobacterium sp.]